MLILCDSSKFWAVLTDTDTYSSMYYYVKRGVKKCLAFYHIMLDLLEEKKIQSLNKPTRYGNFLSHCIYLDIDLQ